MKLTIFGLTISSSWANGHATPYRALIKALHSQGHQITFYEKDAPYYAKHRDFTACDYCELVIYKDWDSIRFAALRDAAGSDAILTGSFLPEGACINDELLALPKPLHIYYDLDTPVTLARLPQGVEYVRASQIPHFDIVFSFTGGRALEELRQVYDAKRALPLYGCVDPEVHRRIPVPNDFPRAMLSYMGTFAADRQAKMDEMFYAPARALADQRFFLAGAMFPWHQAWPKNLQHFPHVNPADHPLLYSASRLTLNLTRAEMAANGYCPSGRFFEAAACGTPIITDRWEGLETFFEDGVEIFTASTAAEVMTALSSTDAELERMAERARERTLAEHSGATRARQLIAALEDAKSSRGNALAEVA